MPAKKPPFKRLYENYTVRGDCWVWDGNKTNSGYGIIKAFGKMVTCHRLSYELYNGKIPDGIEIMHSCDNPICINPDHLSTGTHKDNMRDMIKKNRRVQGKPNPRKGSASKQSIQVFVLGKAYGSLKEAERELGLGSGTVRFWVNNNPAKAKIITEKEYNTLKQEG